MDDEDIRNRLRGSSNSSSELDQPAPRPYVPGPRPVIPTAAPTFDLEPPQTRANMLPETLITEPPRNKSGKKKLLIILILFVAVLLAAVGFLLFGRSKKEPQTNKAQTTVQTPETEPAPTGTIRFIATGDNFTFDAVNEAAKKPDGTYDYTPLFVSIKPLFDKADIRLCNQSVPAGGTALGISGFPSFNAPTEFAKSLSDVGCNTINLATVHMNDKGQPGIDASIGFWESQTSILGFSGANKSVEDQNKIRYFTLKGIKFAHLAYTTTSYNTSLTPQGVNIYTDELALKQVEEARKNADLVLVSMNWGTENSPDIDANQDRIAQALANLNVDVIIGAGPRVLQPAKILDSPDKKHQTLVWFSLGNFLNSQVPIENLIGGIAIMNIDVATQNITDPSFLPVYMHYEWTAEQKRRQSPADLLARRNLTLLPLDRATEHIERSQNNTTVPAQTDRVKGILTKFAPIKVITSAEY